MKKKVDDYLDAFFNGNAEPVEALYECSRCLSINKQDLSGGSAGLCSECEEVDYWDLKAIFLDGVWEDIE